MLPCPPLLWMLSMVGGWWGGEHYFVLVIWCLMVGVCSAEAPTRAASLTGPFLLTSCRGRDVRRGSILFCFRPSPLLHYTLFHCY